MALFRRVKPPFGLKTLQKDSNCIAIQDPSAVWGVQDFLPRRNLLTYTEDFSNAAWVATLKNGTLTSGQPGVNGNNGTLYVEDSATNTYRNLTQTGTITAKVGERIVCYFDAKYYANRYIVVYPQSANNLAYATFNLQNGTVTATGGAQYYASSITALSNGYYRCSVTITAGTAEAIKAAFYSQPGSGAIGSFSGDGASGIYISQSGLYRADTLDQSYQRVTDWTTEQYAWAAQKQVPWLRRNALSQTSLSGGVDNTSAPTGWTLGGTGGTYVYETSAADATEKRIVCAGSTTRRYISLVTQSLPAGSTWTASVNVEAYTGSQIGTALYVVGLQSGYSGTITANPATTGRLSVTFTQGSAAGTATIRIGLGCELNCGTDCSISLSQPMLAATGTSYQPILADWDATYTANAIAAGYPIALWQDSAGTKAVNADNQAIGACRDLKYGDYGPELVTSPIDFSDSAKYDLVNSIALNNSFTTSASGGVIFKGVSLDSKWYLCVVTYSKTSGAESLSIRGAIGTDIVSSTDNTKTLYCLVYPVTAQKGVYIRVSNIDTVTITSLSIKEIPGYTAIQATTANQPKWRLDANGKDLFERDGVNDAMPITLTTVVSDSQLGPELVTNGTFTGSATGWTLSANVSYSNNAVVFDGGSTSAYARQEGITTEGKTYRVGFTISSYASGGLRFMGGVGGSAIPMPVTSYTSTGDYSFVFTASSANAGRFWAYSYTTAFNGTVDNISVREVTGTNVVYTAEQNVTLKDSGLILSGSYAPITPAADYGRIIMAADSRHDAKIIKYLDGKRGRGPYVLGPELVTNGSFSSDSNWNKGAGWSITGGLAVFSGSAGVALSQDSGLSSGKTYAVTFTITQITSGWATIKIGFDTVSGAFTSVGTYTFVGVRGTNSYIYVVSAGTSPSFSIDNISVREVLL